MGFDPIQYKRTTRQQWEDAAEAWHRWGPTLEAWLGPATESMLDAAGVTAGAAGARRRRRAPAARPWPPPAGPAPDGRVVATDISPTILTYAAKAAAEAGLTNVETVEADGEDLDDAAGRVVRRGDLPGRADLLPRPAGAPSPACAARCATGGRLAAVVYSTPDRNEFFSLPVSIIRERAQLPPPAARPARAVQPRRPRRPRGRAARGAGFRDVSGRRRCRRRCGSPSAAECVRFERESFGALHQMLAGVAEAERPGVWAEIEAALARFETADGSSARASCSSPPATR